jgi:hypothetical protein
MLEEPSTVCAAVGGTEIPGDEGVTTVGNGTVGSFGVRPWYDIGTFVTWYRFGPGR